MKRLLIVQITGEGKRNRISRYNCLTHYKSQQRSMTLGVKSLWRVSQREFLNHHNIIKNYPPMIILIREPKD